MRPAIPRAVSGVYTEVMTISPLKHSVSQRPPSHSAPLGRVGYQTMWRCREPGLGASGMARPAASDGRMSEIIIMASLPKPCSPYVLFLVTELCSMLPGGSTMSPVYFPKILKEGKISCEVKDP